MPQGEPAYIDTTEVGKVGGRRKGSSKWLAQPGPIIACYSELPVATSATTTRKQATKYPIARNVLSSFSPMPRAAAAYSLESLQKQ